MKQGNFELEINGKVVASGHTYGYLMSLVTSQCAVDWAIFKIGVKSRFGKSTRKETINLNHQLAATMRERGHKWSWIAEKLDCNMNTLIAQMRKNPAYTHLIKSHTDDAKIIQLRKKGNTHASIARRLKISESTVLRVLMKCG